MTFSSAQLRWLIALVVIVFASATAPAEEPRIEWRPGDAAKYLDEREKTWIEFPSAKRGQEKEQSSCISCHSVLGYALARPVLRKVTGVETPTEYETKLLAQTKRRVENWNDLDTASFGLLYDFNERKKRESWGTEAVVNAVILAFDDHYQGKSGPSDATKQAFTNLWKTQTQTGDHKGTWDWLDFDLEPWEATGSRYYGAALAAIAVGIAPGYHASVTDSDLRARLLLLQEYLRDKAPAQNLFNQAWCLWASTKFKGVLTKDEKNKIIGRLLDKQRDDGGWSLSSLGTFERRDGSAQDATSDGYATGLVLHVLQLAGVPKDEAKLAKGLGWLRKNQAATGAWRGVSVNKERDPATHVGKFMSDAATAYAVLALSH
jgi:squalene-hopene/tetraprenyl-beta-curcumene cyclase